MLKLLNESDLSTLLSNAKSNMKILDGQISSLNKEWPHHVNLIGFLKKIKLPYQTSWKTSFYKITIKSNSVKRKLRFLYGIYNIEVS